MRARLFTQLQAIDQRLASYAREREALLAEFAEHGMLQALRDQRRDLASRLKHERAQSSDLQWELADLELRLRTLEEQEAGGPSDLLVARELVMLREGCARLEEQVLRELERIAELEVQLAEAERTYEQRATAWSMREPELQARIDQLGRELEALQAQRQTIVQRLPPSALELYDDLQRRHRGTALAPVRKRQCSVCYARLPAAVFDMLAMPDPLVRCPRCGRVLYLEE
jgi:predicted  nucleic acid-binding Zn-ribbon protein